MPTTNYHRLDRDVPFFFQAEDGIRHLTVTGVQTCALPISGTTIAILNAPKGYERTLGKLPSVTRKSNARTAIDFVQFFTREKRELERRFATLAQALAPAGMLWISWPKKASGVATDLTEDVIRVT